jgi:molybdopterin synthase catalytic subunit
MNYGIQEGPLDVVAIRACVEHAGHGALLIFEGVARDNFDGRAVHGLDYEAYAGMAVPVMEAIGAEAAEAYGAKVAIWHRTGHLEIGETSLVIAVGTAHRGACYEASRYVIEEVKKRLPVWKKELYSDGEAWKPNSP